MNNNKDYIQIRFDPSRESAWDKFVDHCALLDHRDRPYDSMSLAELIDTELLKYSATFDRGCRLIEFESKEHKMKFILRWS